MEKWMEAGIWGLISGGALVIGAVLGYFLNISQKTIAIIMAFGAGVLISALSFELMDEAFRQGGFYATAFGFILGGLIYSLANYFLSKYGARHRKRSQSQQPAETDRPGSGTAIALGALLDGIPESIAIGISMIQGGAVSTATVIAIFLSNLPEGLSSSAGMKRAKRSKWFIFGLWGAIAVITGLAAISGYSVFSQYPPKVVASTLAVAAGAILAMLADTMIPEAFEKGHNLTGFTAVIGFLIAFILSKLSEQMG
ncbi:MAG: hypothetical protein ABFD10_13435 [Prolixibacteraceae bacterium]